MKVDQTFRLEQRSVGPATVLYLNGPLRLGYREASTGQNLSDAIRCIVNSGTALVAIDLGGLVKTPDSGGLGELVAAELALRQHGGKLVLMNLPPKLHQVIQKMGLLALFAIVETEEEALALFEKLKRA